MAQNAAEITIVAKEGPLASSVSRAIGKGIQGAAGDLRTFDRELERANKRVISFGASASFIYGTIRAFKELVTTTIEVEKQLASINSIFGLTQRELDSFSRTLFATAKETGQAFSNVAKAAEEFSRQGLSVEETAKRTRDALILVRLTGLDVTKAVEGLTATMSTFGRVGETTTSVINKLVAVDQKFAVSSRDIIEAFARAGNVIDNAGVSLEEFTGLVTAARQITGRAGADIGNAFKNIFTRLERTDTIDKLESLGIATRDASGAAKNGYEVFNALAASYKSLTREQRQYVDELSAGVFQINQFKAIINDATATNGIAAQATKTAAEATNEALIRNAALNQTLAASVNNLKASATEAASVVGNLALKPSIKGAIGTGNIVADIFGKAKASGDTKAAEDFGAYLGESILKGLGNVIAGPGLIFAAKLVGVLARRTGGEVVKDVVQSYSPRNTGTDVGNLQTVNSLLEQGTRAEQARFQAAKTLAEQEAIILGILERQALLQARLAGVPAPSRGLRGGAAGRFAAGGYLPNAIDAESAAIGAGVGGAPFGARPVVIPSFKFGGGKRGPLVANTSEYRVPNLAGGGDGIYNRAMIRKYGLPPGATPVAAGGYVPNAANGTSGPFSNDSYDYGAESVAYIANQQKLLAQRATEEAKRRGDDYVKAQQQILDREKDISKATAELNKQRAADMERGFALLEKEQALLTAKKGLTTKEIQTSEESLSAVQKIYQQARIRGSVLTAPIYNAPSGRSVEENPRYGPFQPYQTPAGGYSNPIPQELLGGPSPGLRQLAQELAQRDRIKRELEATQRIQRSRDRLNGLSNRVQIGTIGASFASAFIPEGTSGQASGKLSGALSSAAQGGALGAGAGSLFGPYGTVIGAAVGALSGGIKGFIDRSVKSFEELATQIEEANSKSGKTLEAASQFINLQGNIKEAVEKGLSGRVVNNLVGQQRDVAQQLPSNIVRKLLGAGSDEKILQEALSDLSKAASDQKTRGNTATAFNLLGEDKTKPDAVAAAGSLVRNQVGSGSNNSVRTLLRRIEDASAKSGASDNLSPFFQGLKDDVSGTGLSLFKDDLVKEVIELAKKSDLDPDQEKEVIERIKSYKTNKLLEFLKGFQNAQDNAPVIDIAAQAGLKIESLRNPLRELVRQRNETLELGGIRGALSNRIQTARSSATLDLGDLTEQGRNAAASGFSIDSARREGALSNKLAFEGVRTNLIESTEKLGGNKDLIEQIIKATGIGDLEKIISTSFKSGDINKSLQDAVLELKKTVAQNDSQIVLAQEQARIDKLLLDAQQNQKLLSSGTFGRDTRSTASTFFSRIGTSSGAARRAEGIDLNSFLTQIGLPQTDVGLGFDNKQRAASVRDNLSALLTGRLGTKVGNSEEALRGATGQLGGQFGDQALASRINAGLDSLRFDPAAARKELLGGGKASAETLTNLANTGELGTGTLVLKGPLDELVKLQEQSKDILVRIAANREQAFDIGERAALQVQSIGIQEQLNDKNLSPRQLGDLANKDSAIQSKIGNLTYKIDDPDSYRERVEAQLQKATATALKNGAKEAAPEVASTMMEAFKVSASGVNGVDLSKFFKSFEVGFGNGLEDAIRGPFHTIEQALTSLIDVGDKVGRSLEANLSNAFGDFIVGASNGRDAFRAFALGVLNDSARAFASKAVQSLLGYAFQSILGASLGATTGAATSNSSYTTATGGLARGGPIGFAGGGGVPVALTGGEFMFGPTAAKQLGSSTLGAINNGTYQKRASGGTIIRGGSGVRDDLFGRAAPGSYVVRKAMVERYGGGFLTNMANNAASGGASLSLSTTPFADGGGVSTPMVSPSGGGLGGGGTFNIGVTVNNNGGTGPTSSSSTPSAGGGADRQFGEILTQRIKQVTIQTLQEQQRISGILRRP